MIGINSYSLSKLIYLLEPDQHQTNRCLTHTPTHTPTNEKIDEELKEIEKEINQTSKVTIIKNNFPLPQKVQESLNKQKQEDEDPLNNLEEETPNFRVINLPRDPIKILEHQKNYF